MAAAARLHAATLPHPGGTDPVGAVEVVVPVARQPGERRWSGLRPGSPTCRSRSRSRPGPAGRSCWPTVADPTWRPPTPAWAPSTGSATRSRRRRAGSPSASRPSASATGRPRCRSAARPSRSADTVAPSAGPVPGVSVSVDVPALGRGRSVRQRGRHPARPSPRRRQGRTRR